MNADELRAEIHRLGPWHHDIEIAPGIRTGEPATQGSYPSECGVPAIIQPEHSMSQIVRDVFPEGLAGRSILDCACNAGGYLFSAARLGAGRSFGFDVREHWIRQARFVARHLPSDNIEFATRELSTLPALQLPPFDVTLFMGIFYHLPDPIAGIRLAADLTTELFVINTASVEGKGDALILNRESTTEVVSGVHGLAWLPTSATVLREILEWCGLPHTRLHFQHHPAGYRRRIQLLAAREKSTFAHYDAQRPPLTPRQPSLWKRLFSGLDPHH